VNAELHLERTPGSPDQLPLSPIPQFSSDLNTESDADIPVTNSFSLTVACQCFAGGAALRETCSCMASALILGGRSSHRPSALAAAYHDERLSFVRPHARAQKSDLSSPLHSAILVTAPLTIRRLDQSLFGSTAHLRGSTSVQRKPGWPAPRCLGRT
jgi:hypothetical protein